MFRLVPGKFWKVTNKTEVRKKQVDPHKSLPVNLVNLCFEFEFSLTLCLDQHWLPSNNSGLPLFRNVGVLSRPFCLSLQTSVAASVKRLRFPELVDNDQRRVRRQVHRRRQDQGLAKRRISSTSGIFYLNRVAGTTRLSWITVLLSALIVNIF